MLITRNGTSGKEVTMSTETQDLRARMNDVIQRHGEWTAMSIQLDDDLNTRNPPCVDTRLARFVRLASDFSAVPLAEARVLDLACLEGHYAIEFALHGAEVVGIEGREDNIAKARFAKEVLGLERLTFAQDDVRNLSKDLYGEFDIVICSGILYHLDVPDVFRFAEQIHSVCKHLAIVDTNISLKDDVSVDYRGHQYHGWFYKEHEPETTQEERLAGLWSSIDNVRSLWLTRPSLYNLLTNVGFTSVLECHVPPVPDVPADRITLIAVKGQAAGVRSSPATAAQGALLSPEHPTYRTSQDHSFWATHKKRIKSYIPAGMHKPLKSILNLVRAGHRSRSQLPWSWNVPWKRR
jgi:2-polyprenyl-3-methyl-5-hydroxy-6-metoxy-1,4-benzoquinol methylase